MIPKLDRQNYREERERREFFWLEQERTGSGIARSLWDCNVYWEQDEDVVDLLTVHAYPKTKYVTAEHGRLRRRFEAVAQHGGWVCYGQTFEGQPSDVALFKPICPRQSAQGFGGKVKTIKYETPIKAEGVPILPWVDEETIALIEQRWGVSIRRDEPFWAQIAELPQVPVAITEGMKKALALLSQGLPAIAVRGICMWRARGTDQLHERLQHFAQKSRPIYIVFDQDTKPTTRKQVAGQIAKLAKAYSLHGSVVHVFDWLPTEGKGIDDYLVAYPEEERWEQLKYLIDNAKSYKKIKRDAVIAKALDALSRRGVSQAPEQETSGQFVPQLPKVEFGKIHVLQAPLGSGKTHRIGQDWVRPWLAGGRFRVVVVLSPLNSLGQQTAQRWGLPHINDYPLTAEGRSAMLSAFSSAKGIVLCPDSLLRLPELAGKEVLLVLDEVNQTLEHMVGGNTLGDKWSEVLRRFIDLSRSACAICASEAVVPQSAVDLLKALSHKPVRYFHHSAPDKTPWQVNFYTGHASKVSGFFAQLVSAVEQGQKLFFVTSSKFAGEKLELLLQWLYPEKKEKVVRIDSDTNSEGAFTNFFCDPDSWLSANVPAVVIASPSVKSGVSIDAYYFDSVWGYFPSGTVDTHYQLLGRYRPPVPRHIYTSDISFGDSDDSFQSWVVKQRILQDGRALIQYLGLPDFDGMTQETSALMDFVASMKASSSAQRSANREYLRQLLSADGHHITDIELVGNGTIRHYLKLAKQEIEKQRANLLAQAVVAPAEHSISWALDTLSRPCKFEDKFIAQKVLLMRDFPNVNFDDPEICLKVTEKHGKLLKAVKLHAHALDLSATKLKDAFKTEQILQQDLQALHKLPTDTVNAFLIHSLGVLDLLDKTYSNNDQVAIAVREKALQLKGYIWRYLRLVVNEEMTPVQIINKIFKKLGLETVCIGRPGHRERVRIYQVKHCPIRSQLVDAYQQYLAEKYRPQPSLSRQDIGLRGLTSDISSNSVVSQDGTAVPTPPPTPPPDYAGEF